MKTSFTNIFLATFTLLVSSGYAKPQNEMSPLSEAYPSVFNSRPLSKETRELMEEKRKAEFKEAQQFLADPDLLTPKNTSGKPSPSLCKHWIIDFPKENRIQIEDGSEWVIDSQDSYILDTWTQGDNIVISPNQQILWGTNYAYWMTNKDRGTAVRVCLDYPGPEAYGDLTTWIVAMDKNHGQIFIFNGQGGQSIWEVSNKDFYLLNEWKNNDTLIIGENNSWLGWFSSYDNIIINVNMNHYVRAKQIYPIQED